MSKKRERDHKAEYRRRMERARTRGLSKFQARGHRKASEARVAKSRAQRELDDAKLQMGLRFLRKDKSFTKAAKEAHISPERLRTEAIEKGILEKRGRRWLIKQDLARRVLIYSNGREWVVAVPDFKSASLVGKHMSAVGSFLRTGEIAYLRHFIGKAVKDTNGKSYVFETRPNILYQLKRVGGRGFEQIYRIVV